MFKEKFFVGGIFYVRGYFYIFYMLIFLKVLWWWCGWGCLVLFFVFLEGGEKDVLDVVFGICFLFGFRWFFCFWVFLFLGW